LVSIAGAGSGREEQCKKSTVLSVLQVQGDRDRIVSSDGQGRASPSAPRTAELWAKHMDCPETEVEAAAALDLAVFSRGAETDTRTWRNCRGGQKLALWTMHGGDTFHSFQPRL